MLPELKTFLIAMSPIVELRGSIPLAIEIYGLSPWSAYLWSVLGNITPIIFIILFLNKLSDYLIHNVYFFNRFFIWLFERTRRNFDKKLKYWDELALFVFVAIPLPMTGVWAGTAAAFIFGIKLKKSFPLIVLGSAAAGLIVLFLTLGVSFIFGY
ncbi:MAG: hypothetical protein US76_03220 [Parcubacteria group bacterium GW2011_GWA2_38_13b]|nr:MAG: hypothetical protein US76_03220 [Parcubacteria group bacterium GW2011_GWA2_38_13b]